MLLEKQIAAWEKDLWENNISLSTAGAIRGSENRKFEEEKTSMVTSVRSLETALKVLRWAAQSALLQTDAGSARVQTALSTKAQSLGLESALKDYIDKIPLVKQVLKDDNRIFVRQFFRSSSSSAGESKLDAEND